MKLIPSLIILPSLAGSIFVAAGNAYAANLIWSVGNPILVYHNYKNRDFNQAFLFSVFSVIALLGVFLQAGAV